MKKRILSMALVLVMLFSMISGTVFATGTGIGSGTSESPWQIGDMVANDGVAEPQGVTVEGSYWVRTADIPAAETRVCQLEEHDHEAGGCEMASVTSNDFVCGMEAHVHSVEAGCINTTEAYTLWTLTAETVSEEESSVAEGSDESAGTEESVVIEEAIETEETEGAVAPEAYMAAADTTYIVTFTAKNGNSSLRYVEIVIDDADGATVGYVDTNRNGTATYDLPAGSYTAIISYTQNSYSYYAEETFTVSNANVTVDLNVTQSYSSDAAQNTYNRTSYFNHVDIRVKGTYTTGTNIDLTTYNIHLANVSIVVDNPGANQDYTQIFTNNNESYEWRWTSVKVYKGAAVHLTCDIYDSTTNTILKSGFTYTFYDGTHNGVDYGSAEFVKAIQQCDIHQGLDFIINPSEIIEAVFYDVCYDWDVVDAQGNYVSELPDGLATLPATAGGYKSGDDHNIDTNHQEGHYVVDETNGKLYTFQGWEWWSHDVNNLKANVLGAPSALTVTDDTVIYGVWTVSDLALAESHITITKKFVDEDGASMEAPAGYHMLLVGPQGGSLEIPLAQFTYDEAMSIYSYELSVYTEGTYTIAEHEYEMEGYTMAPSATVSESVTAIDAGHNHVTAGEGTISADSATFTLDLDYVSRSACAHVGKVDFVNTYAKKTGNPVHNYPDLAVNKLDTDDRSVLQGATFVLYKNYDAGTKQFSDAVAEGISDEYGYLYFRNLQPGIYYLKETIAPEDYLVGYAIYRVNVTLKAGFPTEILYEGAWCEYYEYDMSVEYSQDDGVSWATSRHFDLGTIGNRFRLAAFNEKVNGKLIITKSFIGVDADHLPESVTVAVTYPNGSVNNVVLTKANNWTAELTGLELGIYTLKESAPQLAGYLFDGVSYNGAASGQVTITTGDIPTGYDVNDPVAVVSVGIVNTYDKQEGNKYVWPDLNIVKVRDADGTPLAGAEFTLYQTCQNGELSNPITKYIGVTDVLGQLKFEDLTADMSGDPEAVAVTYYLKETKAPGTYAESDVIYTVQLQYDHKAVGTNPEDGVFYTVYYYDLTVSILNGNESAAFDAGTNQLTVKNTKSEGTLTIQKTFGINNAYMPAEIKATVTGPNNYRNEVTLSPANGWNVTLSQLALGKYVVTESTTATTVAGFPLAEDSVTSVEVTLASGVDDGVDLSVGTAVLKNTYTKEVITPASFRIKKVDEDGKVITSGAEFTLYSDKECTNVVQVQNTGTDGMATFFGFTDKATYYLKETTAPAGYYLSDTIYTVTARQEYVIKDAGTSGAVTEIQMIITIEELNGVAINNIDYIYEIANRAIKPAVVNVTKVWEDDGYHARPENVTITLLRDGTVYDTQVLNEANNWYYSWTGLTDEYVWSVEEVEVPAGYTKEIKAEGYKFTITNTNTNTAPVVPSTPEPEPQPAPQVVNEDVDYMDVSVNKVWVGKGVKHPDAVFVVLYGNDIGREVVELNAANNWTYTWKGLPDNVTWRVDEISVPEGYHKKVEQNGNHFTVSNIHKDLPVTGDDSDLLGLSIMLATAMAGIGLAGCLMVVGGKRKRENEH